MSTSNIPSLQPTSTSSSNAVSTPHPPAELSHGPDEDERPSPNAAIEGSAAPPPLWRFTWLANRRLRQGLPRYRLPLSLIGGAIVTSLRGRTRNIRADAGRLVVSMPVQPVVFGTANLPRERPFVILPNHYERSTGAWVGWGGIVITHAIAREITGTFPIRWVMTSTWQDCYLGPRRVNPKYLHWLLRRLANLYGIILMPADDVEAFARGAALRELFRALADETGQVVAFHPEAGGFETLITPPKGMGRVLALLDRHRITLIPAGVFEADGRINVRFGPAIEPGSLQLLGDCEAAEKVMLRIAGLVPERTRGVFTDRYVAQCSAEQSKPAP